MPVAGTRTTRPVPVAIDLPTDGIQPRPHVIVDAGKIVEGWEAKEVIVEGKLLLDAGEEVVVGDATRRRRPRTKHRGRRRRRTKWVVHVGQGGVLLEERRHAGQ